MKKILKQILITLTVVVFTGCGTGDEGSSSGGNGKLIKIKDLLPEAAKNVLLKTLRVTESDGSFSEVEYFYDDKNMVTRITHSINGSLISETTIESEGDELITKSTRTTRNINPEYEVVTTTKLKYKNKRVDTINSKSESVSLNIEFKPKVYKTKVLKRKGSIVTEYVTKHYDDDKNLLSTHEYKYEVDKLKKTRLDITNTYTEHSKYSTSKITKSYTTYEYDDTLNTISPRYYGDEIFYINNNLNVQLHIPSKSTLHNDNGIVLITNTFEFNSNGLMTKRIMNGSVWTYEYIDKQ